METREDRHLFDFPELFRRGSRSAPSRPEAGRMLFMDDPDAHRSLRLVETIRRSGLGVMCVCRVPERLSADWESVPECYKLSTADGRWNLHPNKLGRISSKAERFLSAKGNSAILLEGMEYLCVHNAPNDVRRFLEDLRRIVTSTGSMLIAPLDPGALDDASRAQIARFGKIV